MACSQGVTFGVLNSAMVSAVGGHHRVWAHREGERLGAQHRGMLGHVRIDQGMRSTPYPMKEAEKGQLVRGQARTE